jgi:hypothetical protein
MSRYIPPPPPPPPPACCFALSIATMYMWQSHPFVTSSFHPFFLYRETYLVFSSPSLLKQQHNGIAIMFAKIFKTRTQKLFINPGLLSNLEYSPVHIDHHAGEMAAMQARASGFNPDRDYSGSNVSKGQLMDENISQMYHA